MYIIRSCKKLFKLSPIVTVYLSSFLILMNLMISLTLFPLYVKYLGVSDFIIGLQSSIFTLSSVAFRLHFDPLADSAGRKLPLLLGSFVFATAPLLVWLSPNFLIMSLARVYQAVGMATFLSAAGSSIADMVFYLTVIFGTGLIFLGTIALSDSLIFLAAPVLIAFGYTACITNYSTWIVEIVPEKLRVPLFPFRKVQWI